MKIKIIKRNFVVFSVLSIAYLILLIGNASAVPANSEAFALEQPDGTGFLARQIGDEVYNHIETIDGYTIIKDKGGWWTYSDKNTKGLLISSKNVVGKSDPNKLGFSKHSKDTPNYPKKMTQDLKQEDNTNSAISKKGDLQIKSMEVKGIRNVLVILLNFSNDARIDPINHTPSYYTNLLFGNTKGSMNDYFNEVSEGQLTIQGTVAGNKWYTVAEPYVYWGGDDDGNSANGDIDNVRDTDGDYIINDDANENINGLAREALDLVDNDVDFSNFDNNLDGYITPDELIIIIIHAGYDQADGTVGSPTDIWSHAWDTGTWQIHDGVNLTFYNMDSENSPMGTFAHETAHSLGLPDLYDSDNGIDYGEVIGDWELMDLGSFNNGGKTPSYPSAWSRAKMGWINPEIITAQTTVSIHQAETIQTDDPEAYRVNINENEYFLIENRQNTIGSYDQYIPESGVLIYHINESMPDSIGNSNPPVRTNDGPPDNSFYMVQLEQPGGLGTDAYGNLFGYPNYRGAIQTAAYSLNDGCQFIFNPKIIPNSSSNVGIKSNISMVIMSPEANVMNVTIYPSATESEIAMQAGIQWLCRDQNPNGSWSDDAGITSLAALSFLNAGYDETNPTVQKAVAFIRTKVQPDGRITDGQDTYETSLAILALVATHNSNYQTTIDNAKNWLVSSQWDESSLWGSVNKDNWQYGGFGYGKNTRPDLSNTQWALMALNAAGLPKDSDAWDKAQIFLARTQNRQEDVQIPDLGYTVNWNPTYNRYNDGGFVYVPGESLAGDVYSYGSMTGAGLWSLLLSGVDKNDPRVQAGLHWTSNNYKWDGNPGMTNPGSNQFYYYVSMSKALRMSDLAVVGGGSWYDDLTNNLIALQKSDGHWVNERDSQFWENNSDLATSYSILSMQTRIIPTDIKSLSYLTFILNSNADFHVYDPLGRHVGKNYETGKIDTEIPGATYTINDNQEISIQGLEPGNYRIKLVGTGTGKYTLDVKGGVGETIVADDSFTSTISKSEIHEVNVNVAMITGLTIHIEEPEIIDTIPPEALIKFDMLTKDIKVYNSENDEEAGYIVLPTKKGKDSKEIPDEDGEKGWELRQYTLKDPASNSLVLILKYKKERKEANVKVVSIQYNNATVITAPENEMLVAFSEKGNVFKELNQKIEVKRFFDAEAEYNANKNQTEIKVKGQKERRETKAGMVILELLTDKGRLTYRY